MWVAAGAHHGPNAVVRGGKPLQLAFVQVFYIKFAYAEPVTLSSPEPAIFPIDLIVFFVELQIARFRGTPLCVRLSAGAVSCPVPE